LVGVIVLAFSRSRVFVVCDSEFLFSWFIELLTSDGFELLMLRMKLHVLAGLLLPDVSGSGDPWFLAWSNIFASE